MKPFTIGPNDAGQRLDKFLAKAVPGLPKSMLYKYLRVKRIKLNGKRCEGSVKLSVGDLLELYINDEHFSPVNFDLQYPFLVAPPDVRVVYEDENLLLLDKPGGLVVHEDDRGEQDTLLNRMRHYLCVREEYNPAMENGFAPALCNRIDRNTGGIVIAAKNFTSLQILSEKIKNREITKKYLCIVHGVPKKKSEILKGFHSKDAATNTVTITKTQTAGSKTALTKYCVLQEKNGLSLLEVELLTGRTHQIRAHMASIGHPLLGDTKYGLNRMNRETGYKYQALYSYYLRFDFKTDAGPLNYLAGKEFRAANIPFLREWDWKLG